MVKNRITACVLSHAFPVRASLFPNSENSLLKMELYLLSLSSSISCRESIDAINRITVIIATFIKNPKTDTELTTRLGIVAFLNALPFPGERPEPFSQVRLPAGGRRFRRNDTFPSAIHRNSAPRREQR